MSDTELLINGYTAYTDAGEFGVSVSAEAPGTTPATSVTVSSVECVMFSIGFVGTTFGAGC
ncbi:LxmA leader domain family RiPP [Microbispora sp. NPDC004025]